MNKKCNCCEEVHGSNPCVQQGHLLTCKAVKEPNDLIFTDEEDVDFRKLVTKIIRTKEHYNQVNHEHCWEVVYPPCGQKIKHLECCLCTKLHPVVLLAQVTGKRAALEAALAKIADEAEDTHCIKHSKTEYDCLFCVEYASRGVVLDDIATYLKGELDK